MKTARLFTLIFFIARALALVSLAAPLTPAQEKIVEQIDTMAKQAEAKADAATAAEATEHADLVRAQADTADAKAQAAKLGSVAAKAEADRAAAVKALAVADKAKWHARELLVAAILGFLVSIAVCGTALETFLRADVAFAWSAFKTIFDDVGSGVLKAFPILLKLAPLLAFF